MAQNGYLPFKAQEVYQVLRQAAKERRCPNYGEIGEAVGLANQAVRIPLYFLWGFCKGRGILHISAIVVNKQSGSPGRGYPISKADWEAMRDKVFDYPWSKDQLD